MKKRIGCITIGQSPREDILDEIIPILGSEVEIIQMGALDGFDREFIEKNMTPIADDYVLVSRLNSGEGVQFGESHIMRRLEYCIEQLEDKVSLILMLCTGVFPESLKSKVPIYFPQKVIHSVMPVLVQNRKLLIVIPEREQLLQSYVRWNELMQQGPDIISTSPYTTESEFQYVTDYIRRSDCEVVLLDCMGYSQSMKDRIELETGKTVILSKTIFARIISELI